MTYDHTDCDVPLTRPAKCEHGVEVDHPTHGCRPCLRGPLPMDLQLRGAIERFACRVMGVPCW